MRIYKRVGSVTGGMTDSPANGLGRGGRRAFTDIHCHCLPGLDDGPPSNAESLDLCRMLVRDGVSVAVATPHQLGRYHDCNQAAKVRQAVHDLNNLLKNAGIPLEVVPGGEVRVDERICRLLADDEILTLADKGKYILLELPHEVFIDIEPLLDELLTTDTRSIIAHAERISALSSQPEILSKWLDRAAQLQITASSLLGELGPAVCKAAWDFLRSGAAALVATDAHNTKHRRPQFRAAFELISSRLGRELACRVCVENPSRVVNGQAILPVLTRQRQEVG